METRLTPEAARYVLGLDFQEHDRERMELLSGKANEGALTAAEQIELGSYCHVGDLLALIRSKARLVLKQTEPNP